jgi:hypothetical protein
VAWDRIEARTINQEVLAGSAAMRKRLCVQALALQEKAAKRITRMTDADIRPAEGMVGVQLMVDGQQKYGYIPRDQVERFRRENPDAVVII